MLSVWTEQPLWLQNPHQCKEFLNNAQVLTNVSIWRNQAANRLLSPGGIPGVHPRQPGLRDGRRFCLTTVSPPRVFFRTGLAASHGEPPWTVFGSVGGDWGDLKLNTMWPRREPRKMVISTEHQNSLRARRAKFSFLCFHWMFADDRNFSKGPGPRIEHNGCIYDRQTTWLLYSHKKRCIYLGLCTVKPCLAYNCIKIHKITLRIASQCACQFGSEVIFLLFFSGIFF